MNWTTNGHEGMNWTTNGHRGMNWTTNGHRGTNWTTNGHRGMNWSTNHCPTRNSFPNIHYISNGYYPFLSHYPILLHYLNPLVPHYPFTPFSLTNTHPLPTSQSLSTPMHTHTLTVPWLTSSILTMHLSCEQSSPVHSVGHRHRLVTVHSPPCWHGLAHDAGQVLALGSNLTIVLLSEDARRIQEPFKHCKEIVGAVLLLQVTTESVRQPMGVLWKKKQFYQ